MNSKKLILVVEDEAALATLLRYNLEKQGFRVEEAADGPNADGELDVIRTVRASGYALDTEAR